MLVFHGAMILVIDGAKLSLFRNRGRDFAIDLELVEHSVQHAAQTADIGTDKPGRSFSSVGHGRSAHETTDFHQADEDDFARAAIDRLNALALQSDFDFIIVAAPHVLGFIRPRYSADLKKRLVAEIDKDYAGRPAADVAELLLNYTA
ncbi:host attachment family protein [Sphingomonas paeninsulae]|nr:host attachment family protein [Sphingomonas paeninsulae]